MPTDRLITDTVGALNCGIYMLARSISLVVFCEVVILYAYSSAQAFKPTWRAHTHSWWKVERLFIAQSGFNQDEDEALTSNF